MLNSTSKLARDRPAPDRIQRTAQVLPFRPRTQWSEPTFGGVPLASDEAEREGEFLDDLAQYQQDREEDEIINYPRRMLMNTIAVAVVTLLIGVGVWLADSISEMERNQDCILQGRQNCAPIELAAPIDIPAAIQK